MVITMGRKPFPLDGADVQKLAALGCTVEEMSDFFKCSRDVINTRYLPFVIAGRAEIRQKLRRWQLRVAEKGNPALLIWLGKQMLNQREPEKSPEAVESEAKAAGQVSAAQLEQLRIMFGYKKAPAK